MFMGIVKDDGGLTFTTASSASWMPPATSSPTDLDPTQYSDYIGEKVEPGAISSPPTTSPRDIPEGIYRVGPLARMNVADRCGTPRADQELAEFHELQRTAVLSSFHYHHARLIEILYCVERMEQLLNDPEILVQARARLCPPQRPGRGRRLRGAAGHSLPPLQDRRTGPDSLGQPHHRDRTQQSRHESQHAPGGQALRARQRLTPGMLNRVEAVIRCYDPCLSCSTHALGEMPLHIQLISPDGEVLDEVVRGTSAHTATAIGVPEHVVQLPAASPDGPAVPGRYMYFMNRIHARLLIVAYGNPLRSDDGVAGGPRATARKVSLRTKLNLDHASVGPELA